VVGGLPADIGVGWDKPVAQVLIHYNFHYNFLTEVFAPVLTLTCIANALAGGVPRLDNEERSSTCMIAGSGARCE